MGRTHTRPKPCCSYVGLSKGPWTHEEDLRLIKYIEAHGEGNWRTLPMKAGLLRCGKGCRLRWVNYLRPNVKRGHISPDEEDMIIRLHKLLGNRWSLIAGRIPGRTDNEVKNYWNTHLRKKSNATTGFTLNARALRGKKPGFELVAPHKKLCRGTINPLCMNENDSSFSPHKDTSSTGHAVKDENSGSACWDIPGIASFLMLDDDLCSRTDYVAIENFKQSIDEFHDTYMDLNTSTINNMHTAWPHENHHPSPMPIIYLPEFDPYKTCPSECMVAGGLYQQYSMSGSFTSMGQQVDNIASENINYRENPTGEVSDLQSKTAGEAQIQVHVPPYGLIHEDNSTAIGCDLFDQCSINTSLLSCLQSEDRTTSQWSETWLSSFDWFDRI